jgi:hypothetical protein
MKYLIHFITLSILIPISTPLAMSQKKADKIKIAKAEFGDLSEVHDKNRVFIYDDDAMARQSIADELRKYKDLEPVSTPEQADFFISFIEYDTRLTKPIVLGSINSDIITHREFIVFTLRRDAERKEERPRILLWGKRKAQRYPDSVRFNRTPSPDLIPIFFSDFIHAYRSI